MQNSRVIAVLRCRIKADHLRELWTYYKVAFFNTIFGLSVFYMLIFIGLNLFVAQFLGTCAGVLFNYYNYRRHVFRDTKPSRVRYLMAYAFNYGLGVPSLFIWHKVVGSPYIAGFCSTILVSLVNYFVLKFLVFHKRAA